MTLGNNNGTDGQTDRQTDGQTECDAICGPLLPHNNTVFSYSNLCISHINILHLTYLQFQGYTTEINEVIALLKPLPMYRAREKK